ARRKSRGLVILSKGLFDNAMSQNSCQPEGLQPESALSALLVLAIERLLPSPGALPSPILAATHTCFIRLGTLRQRAMPDGSCIGSDPADIRQPDFDRATREGGQGARPGCQQLAALV